MNYNQGAIEMLHAVGGNENIVSLQHCASRLRFELRDRKRVNEDALSKIEMVKGINDTMGQFQIILGTGVVNKVYSEMSKIIKLDESENIELKEGNLIQRISRIFGDIFLPVIPVIVASGILMGIRSYLTGTGYLEAGTAWYNVFAILIDTGFSILPALVCYSTVKKFNGSPVFGFVMGMMLISSFLPAAGAVGKGNAEPLIIELLGIEIGLVGYQGSVLVAMFAGWIIAKTEQLFRKHVPNSLDIILTPILTLSVTLFIILFGVGPVIRIIESTIVSSFEVLIKLPLGIGGFIISGLQQLLVITGVHHGLWVIDINFMDTLGNNPYMAIRSASVIGQAGVALAFFIFSKDKKRKAFAGAAAIAAWFGITEPVIFGLSLVLGAPFMFGCIGAAFGGMYAAMVNLSAIGMGVSAIPGYLLFIDGGAIEYTIMMVISASIALILSALYIRKKGL